LVLLCVVLSGCVRVPTVDLTGPWAGSLTYTSGPATGFAFPVQLNLTHEGSSVQGTITLRSHAEFTYILPVVHGRARGGTLLLMARGTNPWVAGEPSIELTLDAEIDSAAILVGVGIHAIDQALYSFTWEATRSADALP
jgi:hypothetical protein